MRVLAFTISKYVFSQHDHYYPDEELAKKAALLKCKHRDKLSLADCYAAAAASTEKATLLTTDTEPNKVANSENIATRLVPV